MFCLLKNTLKLNGVFARLVLIALWLPLLPGCDGSKKPQGKEGRPDPTKAPARAVQIAKVKEMQIERTIVALGSISAYEQATLSAKVSGRLESLSVDIGKQVRKGDPLARIEPRDYQLKEQQAAAALSQTRAAVGLPLEGEDDQIDMQKISTVMEAKAVLDEKRANLERLKELSKQQIIAASQLDTAQSEFLVAANRYQDAQETIQQKQALLRQRRVELEIARQQLTDTTIAAPFDGGIQERKADPGEYLTIGSPLLTLVRLDPLRLRVEVSERDAMKVKAGQVVRFTLEGDGQTFTGAVARLSPALDESTRMLRVEADIANEGRLRPGHFARAEVVTDSRAMVLAIPTNAISIFAGLEKAFTMKEGKAVERRITVGQRIQGWMEVIAGLNPGEEVILNPGNLQTGNPVAPQAEGEPVKGAAGKKK